MKWLDATNPALQGTDFFATSLCVITAQASDRTITGLSAFEPRDLNPQLVDRLAARMKRQEFSTSKFVIYAPPFIAHRLDSLFSGPAFANLERKLTPFLQVKCAGDRFVIRDRLRVLNVDDSPVLLKLLKHGLEEFSYVEVVKQISDPLGAAQGILRARPDVVTMDIQMPGMTGVEVVREVLDREYIPIIMVSSLSSEDGPLVMDSLNAGAFDYIQKPKLDDKSSFFTELEAKFLQAVEAQPPAEGARRKRVVAPAPIVQVAFAPNLLWCLGASTGGTQALTQVLTSLPGKIPPTLIVQHIPASFSKAFAESVNGLCPFTVKEAEHGEEVKDNFVYVAPGGTQMGLEDRGGRISIKITDDAPVNRFKPSVDFLFREVAKIKGRRVIAGVLTGMGRDGAEGLLELRQRGASTFVQDEKTSAVYGMPRAAFEIGAAKDQIALENIAHSLVARSHVSTKVA